MIFYPSSYQLYIRKLFPVEWPPPLLKDGERKKYDGKKEKVDKKNDDGKEEENDEKNGS